MRRITRLCWLLFCGCSHDRVGFPQRDYQRCVECGARRRYRIPLHGDLIIGPWEKPEALAPVRTVVGHGEVRPNVASVA